MTIEKYFELRMLTDYIIPASVLILMIACGLFLLFFKKMCDFHDKRNKWIDEEEGEGKS